MKCTSQSHNPCVRFSCTRLTDDLLEPSESNRQLNAALQGIDGLHMSRVIGDRLTRPSAGAFLLVAPVVVVGVDVVAGDELVVCWAMTVTVVAVTVVVTKMRVGQHGFSAGLSRPFLRCGYTYTHRPGRAADTCSEQRKHP